MRNPPVVPPATIGMLGGGQLGRYALMSAATMGYRTLVLDPDASAPAGVVADDHVVRDYDDPVAVERLGRDCDVVTTEFENPPAAALARLDEVTRVAPSPRAVAIAQHRLAEKRFLGENGFPVAPYGVLATATAPDVGAPTPTPGHDLVLGLDLGPDPDIDPDRWRTRHPDAVERFVLVDDRPSDAGVESAIDELVRGGAIVKTARLGYDGKGQRPVDSVSDLLAAWAELDGVSCVVEQRLDLLAEVSVLVARTDDADEATWPVAENHHVDGILDTTVVPARVDPDVADRAVGMAMAVADALDFVGVLAVEMFVVPDEHGDPTLVVNELAPRPHNSGHWTLDASVTSQFDQQVRAVCGLGLGDTRMTAPAVAMVNLLGDLWFDAEGRQRDPDWAVALAEPHATLHLYGKAVPRPGRKMGHLTVTAATADLAVRAARDLRARLDPVAPGDSPADATR